MTKPCELPGCDEPAAAGHDVCSDPDCFWFTLPFLDGFISAKELAADIGLVPTGDIVCNKDYGFFLEYADRPDDIEAVLNWAGTHAHNPTTTPDHDHENETAA